MAIQYESAGEGYEFRPTKDGKECGLVRKFKLNPALKERVPKRWIFDGLVGRVRVKSDK